MSAPMEPPPASPRTWCSAWTGALRSTAASPGPHSPSGPGPAPPGWVVGVCMGAQVSAVYALTATHARVVGMHACVRASEHAGRHACRRPHDVQGGSHVRTPISVAGCLCAAAMWPSPTCMRMRRARSVCGPPRTWNSGSARAALYCTSSSSSAGMRVSGTYLPPNLVVVCARA